MTPKGDSWAKSMTMGAQSADVFRGNQAEAEQTMARAGVKPPRVCQCSNPCQHTDADGDSFCIYCGRAPRERA